MKKLLCAALATISLSAATAKAGIFPEVVSQLDLGSFTGKWYQVASTNPFFQAGCVCVTATYTARDDHSVTVANSCRKETARGEIKDVIGTAYTTNDPAKLNVVFGGPKLPFSNYWIVDLANDYSYAVISTPLRTPIWILSRTPELPEETLTGIYSRLKSRAFPTWSISPTLQTGCYN